ncbi:hypothetical protein [Kribbella sp. NPDC049584]|uniref:hypothetical protein n=1 Tax=Kribbella sp. NPDC049584 TaxID=3154833 RepID=UPI0034460EB5
MPTDRVVKESAGASASGNLLSSTQSQSAVRLKIAPSTSCPNLHELGTHSYA